jgi:hypothetical protein
MKNLINLFTKIETNNIGSGISESKDVMILELNQTIEKFNKTIQNPKLINTLLESSRTEIDHNTKRLMEEIEMTDDEFFRNEINLIETVQKLETQIKRYMEENQNLHNQLRKNRESQVSANDLSEKTEEINKFRRKLNDEKLQREEAETTSHYIKQLNKDLESKLQMLEEENKNLKKNMKLVNEKLKDLQLTKNKNVNLENEIKYKESIISYLETLLKGTKIAPNMYDEIRYQENFQTSKRNDSRELYPSGEMVGGNDERDRKQNFYKNDINEINESEYEFQKSVNERNAGNIYRDIKFENKYEEQNSNNYDKYDKYEEDLEYRIKKQNYNKELNNSKGSSLKNEIESLDSEIKQLQNKLRVMIDVNKK